MSLMVAPVEVIFIALSLKFYKLYNDKIIFDMVLVPEVIKEIVTIHSVL